ncbi:MAG: hypothetical protein COB30_016650 [Ectothiorhodospiraceae bacterium]|nr:hypothetical protein [Ectothiorhodospiraceae bacterium]
MPTKSGSYWVAWANAHAKNSNKIFDLTPSFRNKAKDFITALEGAGIKVGVSTTKRSDIRAYLFHWSWMISQGKCKPSDAIQMNGVDIKWDHGDVKKSKAGALAMVTGFGLAVPPRSINPPSMTSNHINGKAIDMTLTWAGTIKVKKKDGTEASLTFMSNVNTNSALHTVGESYGVKKLKTDAPHWSFNGR